MKRFALLRCCASCEWVFKAHKNYTTDEFDTSCPKCNFVSYSANYVHPKKCYQYQYTQKPWFDKKMNEFAIKLLGEINESNYSYRKRPNIHLPPYVDDEF